MFLAIRELAHAKIRYALIGLIIVLIASLIFIISGLAKGLSADNASAIQNMQADYILMDTDAELEMTKSFISRTDLDNVLQMDGVEQANSLSVRMMNASVNGSDQNEDVALFVTDGDSMLLPSVRDGSPITQEDEAIVDASLQREGIEIGDRLVFGEESELTVVGFTDNQRYSHTPVVFVDGGGRETINAIAISVDESRADEIRNAVGNSFDMVTKDEALKGIPSYSQEQASLNMMIVFLFVITAFVLAAFFYVITLQKRDQFGVLKALGAKTTYLAQNLVGQVVLISIMCIGIAMGLTLGIAELLPEEMPFLLTADEMVQTSILILIVSIIGAFLSLIQIVKIDPIEAIEGAGK
ncbi:ABC transporter permease [Oceanobacillus profundus]|uniref:ABC transporter permease n=1 Tax=Oceanobacillus profundus TaxID=372463 RepID=UPI00203ADCDE|nr:ABC transporter permease [Oceanobacillus profundus]MCM3400013.1 ABC transporter permease [Oceanobacillus profundus]